MEERLRLARFLILSDLRALNWFYSGGDEKMQGAIAAHNRTKHAALLDVDGDLDEKVDRKQVDPL